VPQYYATICPEQVNGVREILVVHFEDHTKSINMTRAKCNFCDVKAGNTNSN
jgi:hypothetical protein